MAPEPEYKNLDHDIIVKVLIELNPSLLVPSLRVGNLGLSLKKRSGRGTLGLKTWIHCLQNKFRLTEKNCMQNITVM